MQFSKVFLLLLFLIALQGYHFSRIFNNVGFAQILIYTNDKHYLQTGHGNPIVCTLNGGASVQIGIHIDNSGCSNNVMVATRLSRFRSWLRKPSKENAFMRKLKTGENGGTGNIFLA
jgi:secreted trypsin-like serine protease